MTAKEIAVEKYIVRLSLEEREQLSALISGGKHPARKLLKARILLKADVSDAGEGWSDSRIAAALDTRPDTPEFIRHALSQGQQNHIGPGQSQHPQPASFYEAFPPQEACRLVERFEWHFTPNHGSWLDMAETELSVLSRQCLDRRIPNNAKLIAEVTAWQDSCNKKHAKADRQFTTADARIKLKRLYPAME